MTIPKWHALVLHVQAEGRVPFQFKTVGEARRAQLHFNKMRRYHLDQAFIHPHDYPRGGDVITLYQSITSEIDRNTSTLYLCSMTAADRCFLEYLDKADPLPEPPEPTPEPFQDLRPNGTPEKPYWDPS